MSPLLWLGVGTLLLLGGATAGIILRKSVGAAVWPIRMAFAGLGIAACGFAFAGMDQAFLAEMKFALIRMSGNLCHCLP